MSLLKWLSNVSPFRGMPTDDKSSSSSITDQTGETVTLYYDSSSTLTKDAGQAAGVIVVGKFTYNNMKNTLGDMEAKQGDTSLSFTCTAATNEVGRAEGIDHSFIEAMDEASWPTRLAAIGTKLASQGDYYVDYTHGVIYINKATTASTMTGTGYKYVSEAGTSTSSSFTTATKSDRVEEIDPTTQHFVGETLVSVTNETDGTNNYYVDMAGFAGLDLQLVISGGSGTMTVTVEASAQDDGTAAASCTYTDVTSDVFGSASFTASTYLFDDAKVLGGSKYVKVKTVSSTGGANDADITVYSKKLN